MRFEIVLKSGEFIVSECPVSDPHLSPKAFIQRMRHLVTFKAVIVIEPTAKLLELGCQALPFVREYFQCTCFFNLFQLRSGHLTAYRDLFCFDLPRYTQSNRQSPARSRYAFLPQSGQRPAASRACNHAADLLSTAVVWPVGPGDGRSLL